MALFSEMMDETSALRAENARLKTALERTLPVLAAAAAGASVQIAAGEIYRETQAALTTSQRAEK